MFDFEPSGRREHRGQNEPDSQKKSGEHSKKLRA
jgi:hypothetical protein